MAHSIKLLNHRYICERCEHTSDEPSHCIRCPDELLLDLQDERVREMLSRIDHRNFMRSSAYGVIAGVVVATLFCILAAILISQLLGMIFGGMSRSEIKVFGRLLGYLSFGAPLLFFVPLILTERLWAKRFKPKRFSRYWGGEEIQDKRGLWEILSNVYDRD